MTSRGVSVCNPADFMLLLIAIPWNALYGRGPLGEREREAPGSPSCVIEVVIELGVDFKWGAVRLVTSTSMCGVPLPRTLHHSIPMNSVTLASESVSVEHITHFFQTFTQDLRSTSRAAGGAPLPLPSGQVVGDGAGGGHQLKM